LADEGELIVLAKVESVTGQPGDENRRAKAMVKEVWKGAKVDSVEYRVSPTFVCDISYAKQGETVLLFLVKEGTGWGIAWVGRGRMPMKKIDGKEYLTHFVDVIFPAGTPHAKSPEKSDGEFDQAVELSIVKELVRKEIDKKK
jgi:hypothetical protein